MIEQHPRFTAPDIIRVPSRFCALDPADPTPPSPQGQPNRLKLMQDAKIITLTVRPAASGDCASSQDHAVVDVALTDVASSVHPMPLADGRGWAFVAAHRRFVTVDRISYDNPDDPKMAHVDYAWAWEPDLLGQLLEMGSIAQGASATLLRNGNGWIVRQPGM